MPKNSRRRKGRESRLGKRVVRNTRKLHGGSVAEVTYMREMYKSELVIALYKNIHESKLEVSINLAKSRCHVENLVVKSTLEMAIAMYNELNDDTSEVSKALTSPTAPVSAAAPSSTTAPVATPSSTAPAATVSSLTTDPTKRPDLTAEFGGKPPIKAGINLIPNILGKSFSYKSNLYNAIIIYIDNINLLAIGNVSKKDNTLFKDTVAKEKELFDVERRVNKNIPQKGDMYKMTTYIKDIINSMDAIYAALNLAAHPTIPLLPESTNTPDNVGAYANSLITSGKADRAKKTDVAATAAAATAATVKAKTAAGAVDDPLIADKCKGVYEITVWFGEDVNKKLFERLTLIHSLNSFEAAYIKLATNIFELTDDAAVPKPVVAPSANPPAAGGSGGGPPPAVPAVGGVTDVPPPDVIASSGGVTAAPAVSANPAAASGVPPPAPSQKLTPQPPSIPPTPLAPNTASQKRRSSV